MTLLRGCIILQAGANRPVACVILSLRDLRCGFAPPCGANAPGAVCVRFNRAVSPPVGRSLREPVCSRGVLRGFDGLANTTATLGSFYWLGFETSGLSPDKKRLAWLGAQRPSAGARYRERQVATGFSVRVKRVMSTHGEVAGCSAAPCSAVRSSPSATRCCS